MILSMDIIIKNSKTSVAHKTLIFQELLKDFWFLLWSQKADEPTITKKTTLFGGSRFTETWAISGQNGGRNTRVLRPLSSRPRQLVKYTYRQREMWSLDKKRREADEQGSKPARLF